VPAAAVIPAPAVYTNVAAVRTLVVDGKAVSAVSSPGTHVLGAGLLWAFPRQSVRGRCLAACPHGTGSSADAALD